MRLRLAHCVDLAKLVRINGEKTRSNVTSPGQVIEGIIDQHCRRLPPNTPLDALVQPSAVPAPLSVTVLPVKIYLLNQV